jgi:hypothetical protein
MVAKAREEDSLICPEIDAQPNSMTDTTIDQYTVDDMKKQTNNKAAPGTREGWRDQAKREQEVIT